MDNTIDTDQAIGLAFKLAHRMRAAQVAAGWDAVEKCLDPTNYNLTHERAERFANFLITPDERNLSSYNLRAEALETAIIAMEGVISRCRIGFQVNGSKAEDAQATKREKDFLKAAKDYMKGSQVCQDAQTILNQMIDLQVELLQPLHNEVSTVNEKVKL